VHSSIRSLRSPLGTEFVLSVPTIPLSTDRTWVLLHGTDGHETDLLPLADRLAPDDAKIALRGTEPTAQGWAHFRRRPDRTLDEDDLRARIALLTDAVDHGQAEVGPTARRVVLGFSNGAIAAAERLRATGAVVDHVTLPVHHGITARDEDETRRWWGGVAVTS
jgi:phospholipase/carboxylesterase